MFLLVHIGFVGVHSGNVNMGGFFGTNGGFLVHLGGGGYIWGVFWYLPGGFLLQNGGGLVGTTALCPLPSDPLPVSAFCVITLALFRFLFGFSNLSWSHSGICQPGVLNVT